MQYPGRMAEPREQTEAAGTSTASPGCSSPTHGITRVFELLGKRWTGVIIAALMSGPGHFTELRRAVPGISERMLSDRLGELAALHLVLRTVDEGPPLRVSYALTEAGLALRPAMVELTRWADAHLPEGGSSCPQQFQP